MKRLFYTHEKTDNRIFSWIIGWQPSYGWMLLNDKTKQVTLFLDGRYAERAVSSDVWTIEKVLLDKKITELLSPYITENEILYIEKALPWGVVDFLQTSDLACVWEFDIEKRQQQQRICKTPEAIVATKKAIACTEKLWEWVSRLALDGGLCGKTELEVRGMLIAQAYAWGCTGEAFDTIVAFGENSAIPHHETGNTVIRDGPLLIDMGWIWDGWCSDFTRTIWIGASYKKPPVAHSLRSGTMIPLPGGESDHVSKDEFEEVVSIVRAAHDMAQSLVVVGVALKDIAAAARQVIDDAGYGKYFTHSLGHGVGRDVHEAPGVHMKSKDSIETGMIFTIEPGIYLPGKFGVRWENIVIIE